MILLLPTTMVQAMPSLLLRQMLPVQEQVQVQLVVVLVVVQVLELRHQRLLVCRRRWKQPPGKSRSVHSLRVA